MCMCNRGLFVQFFVSDFIALHIKYSIPVVVDCKPDHHIFASYSPGKGKPILSLYYRRGSKLPWNLIHPFRNLSEILKSMLKSWNLRNLKMFVYPWIYVYFRHHVHHVSSCTYTCTLTQAHQHYTSSCQNRVFIRVCYKLFSYIATDIPPWQQILGLIIGSHIYTWKAIKSNRPVTK